MKLFTIEGQTAFPVYDGKTHEPTYKTVSYLVDGNSRMAFDPKEKTLEQAKSEFATYLVERKS